MAIDLSLLGFVVIGRNEGDRLKASLNAIVKLCPNSPVVYVDSGSTDDSVEFAKSLQLNVVELDMSTPFTAARARNAGFKQLIEAHTALELVHFLDGDCELQEGWVESATSSLLSDESVGIVSGRRLERYKEASIYNTLMDIEWDTPIGETKAVPGDMCVKVSLFNKLNGFTENIIAAEDDDLCIRARSLGYKILRLDASMSVHDANIMKLSQWYKRSKRGGHGYANINHIHGGAPEFYFRKNLRSTFFWGCAYPLATILTIFIAPVIALLLILLYTAFITRTTKRLASQGHNLRVASMYSLLIYTGKIPEFLGVIEYWKTRLLSRQHKLIEYK